MNVKRLLPSVCMCGAFITFALPCISTAQTQTPANLLVPQKIIIDTDIGDDVDDAFAIGLALSSKEVNILGIMSAWGDTALRAKMLDRFLCEVGRTDIPVAVGVPTESKIEFSQAAWAKRGIKKNYPDAVGFLLDEIRKYPGQITLVAIAPLTNVGAAIDQDPKTFSKLKGVAVMGGSISKGYDDRKSPGPDAEYNIRSDISAARKLLSSGVPIYLMPLDSTMIPLDEVMREQLFTESTPLTDILTLLYHQWTRSYHWITPTLFDAVPVAYVIRPELCQTAPVHIHIDDEGFTREDNGPSNVQVCLQSNPQQFLQFYMPRLLNQRLSGNEDCRSSAHVPQR